MGVGNVLLLSQVIAFLVSFLGSFFIFIPVSLNLQEFDGHCLLGAKGTWNFSGPTVMLTDIKWGLHSDCGFAVFIGVVVMIISVLFIIWQSVYLFKNTDRYFSPHLFLFWSLTYNLFVICRRQIVVSVSVTFLNCIMVTYMLPTFCIWCIYYF